MGEMDVTNNPEALEELEVSVDRRGVDPELGGELLR